MIINRIVDIYEAQFISRQEILTYLRKWEALVREMLAGNPKLAVKGESTGFTVHEEGFPVSVFTARLSTVYAMPARAWLHTSPLNVVEVDVGDLDDMMEVLLAFRFGKYLSSLPKSKPAPPPSTKEPDSLEDLEDLEEI